MAKDEADHSLSNQVPVRNNEEADTVETDKKTNRNLTKREFYFLASLIYNQFWAAACYSIQAPFFPKEAESKGVTPTEYGMVFSVFELMVILMSPICGRMIPAVSPKFLIVAGSFLEGGASLIFGVLDRIDGRTPFFVLALLTRMTAGLGAAAFMTACFTFVSSEFPNAIGRAMSLTETAFGFGLIGGPAIGGILYEAEGFLLPFIVCGGMMLIGSSMFLFFLPSIDNVEAQRPGNMRRFLMDPGVQTHIFAIITSTLFLGFNAASFEPHLRKFNLKPAIVGSIFIIFGSAHALAALIWGWLADKGVSSYFTMGLGYVIAIVGTLFIGPVPFLPFKTKLWTVIVSFAVICLGLSAKLMGAFTGTVKIAPSLGFPDNLATHGMICGLLPMAVSIGSFIGPFLGGLLPDTIGYEAGTCVILGQETFFLLLLVALVVWKKRNPQNIERSPLLMSCTKSLVVINDSDT